MKSFRMCIRIATLVFVLCSCSNTINNPSEISVNSSGIKYTDNRKTVEEKLGTGDEAKILLRDGYTYDNDTIQFVYNKEDEIRVIKVLGEKIGTFNNIHVGDSKSKILDKYEYELEQSDGTYMVLFDGTQEMDPRVENKSDDWIWISYQTDKDKIENITIYDVYFAENMK